MLAPHELKNKQFQKTFKGYNPQEVDEYLEFVLEKYTEAYRENSELERKLRIVVTNLRLRMLPSNLRTMVLLKH